MVTVGALARFEFKPGNEAAIERFFQEGQLIVQRQPASTLRFGFWLGPTTYGVFAAFANEEDRHALLSTGGPVLAKKVAALFAQPPIFEKVDVLAAKLPKEKEGNVVTRGFLIQYEVKYGNEAGVVEHSIKEWLPAVQEEPGTITWFAFRLGPSTFGIFDAFPDEEGRQAHWNTWAAQLQNPAFVENSLVVEKADVFEARLSE